MFACVGARGHSNAAARCTLQELQRREEAVRNGKLATIIFVRDFNAKGQEVSGYIDFGERLSGGSMEAVFALKQRLLPRPTDLSFYNWDTHGSSTNPTMDFQARPLGAAVCFGFGGTGDCGNRR